MSVYQVEEYYVSIEVPSDKVEAVKEFINSESLDYGHFECEWDGDTLNIDNFDSEMYADDANCQIMSVIEGD